MKTATILATLALGGLAFAQTAPPQKPNAPQTRVQTGASSLKSPFAPQTKTQTPAQKAAAPAQKPAVAKQAPVPAPKKPVQAKAEPKKAEPMKAAPAQPVQAAAASKPNLGKRDPFISPIAALKHDQPAVNCNTGKRCLVVDQVVLKGIVQMKNGNFALVENPAKRPYVLHENDALFNGTVVKINGDSVVFRESGKDLLGHETTKDVIKKVSAPAV